MSNRKYCISIAKSTNKQCKFKAQPNSDYCKKHQVLQNNINNEILPVKTPILEVQKPPDTYLNKYLLNQTFNDFIKMLNTDYSHTLLGLADDWNEIPQIYLFRLDDMWWDIRSLIRIFTGQLDRSNMGQSYPMYPENPFTRKRILPRELKTFNDRITYINENIQETLNIDIVLRTFLNISLQRLLKIYKQELYDSVLSLVHTFEKTMRYKLINCQDSQGNFCGYWVNIKEKITRFEKCVIKINHSTVIVNGMLFTLETPTSYRLRQELNNMPKEEYIY